MQPCVIIKNALMHKNELKAHPTLINCVIKEYALRAGTTGTHRNINSFKIKF